MSTASAQNFRKLELKKPITPRLMWMLKNEAGYSLIAETLEYYEFERPVGFLRNKPPPRELSDEQKRQLTKRLNTIADIYLDPMLFRDDIIQRIRNITRTMTSLESDFCWEWVERNLEYT